MKEPGRWHRGSTIHPYPWCALPYVLGLSLYLNLQRHQYQSFPSKVWKKWENKEEECIGQIITYKIEFCQAQTKLDLQLVWSASMATTVVLVLLQKGFIISACLKYFQLSCVVLFFFLLPSYFHCCLLELLVKGQIIPKFISKSCW